MAIRRRRCPPGHHWAPKEKRCVPDRKPPPKQPPKKPTGPGTPPATVPPTGSTTTTTTTPDSSGAGGTADTPFGGTITPAVATPDNTGTSEAPPGGDLTGTATIASEMSSVFGSGPSGTPQYHYEVAPQQAEQTAQQLTTQPQVGQ